MGAMIGFLAGYLLGTRAGKEGLEELREAVTVIAQSEEVRALLAGGLAAAADLVSRGGGVLAERVASGDGVNLRKVA